MPRGKEPGRVGQGLTWQLCSPRQDPAAPPPLAEPPAASSGWAPQGHPHCRVTGRYCDSGHPSTHPGSRALCAQHPPEEGDLRAVHSRAEPQGWVLAKRRHDEAEEQGQAHKEGRQHDLGDNSVSIHLHTCYPAPTLAPPPPLAPQLLHRQQEMGCCGM